MKRRLRKKLQMGEFAVYGFAVEANLHAFGRAGITLNKRAFIDNFLAYCDHLGLGYGGSIGTRTGGSLYGYVTRVDGTSATDKDRAALKSYLAARDVDADGNGFGLVTDVWVGPLVDGNTFSWDAPAKIASSTRAGKMRLRRR